MAEAQTTDEQIADLQNQLNEQILERERWRVKSMEGQQALKAKGLHHADLHRMVTKFNETLMGDRCIGSYGSTANKKSSNLFASDTKLVNAVARSRGG